MGVREYDIAADIGALEELSERQRSYIPRLQAILDDVSEQVMAPLNTNWTGDASELFNHTGDDFKNHFYDALMGLSRMVDATDGTVDNYRELKRYLVGLYS